jgi:hypothetical protein
LRAELPSAAAARAALLQGYQSTQVVAGRDPSKFAMPAMGHIAVRNVPQAPTQPVLHRPQEDTNLQPVTFH